MSWTEMVLCWIAGNVNKKHRSLLGLPETAQNCPRTLQEGSRDASKGGRKISQPPPLRWVRKASRLESATWA